MTSLDILKIRLQNQHLTESPLCKPSELVKWLGAVQSQDFPGAKWGLSQRLNFIPDYEIEKEFNNGKFLRTHVLRPTWHFVHPDDIAWMLDLTGKRVKSVMNSYNKALGLNEELFEKSKQIFKKTLKNKNYLNRMEMGEALNKNGIKWTGNGLAHIVMWSELDKIICSGPLINNKQTYALFEERVPSTKSQSREESLMKLVKSYFQSHGPAQIKDYVWWSGLNTVDAKIGIEANKSLLNEEINGKTYYFFKHKEPILSGRVYLLPNYDEYTIAYRDREDLYKNVDHTKLDERQNALFNNAVIINGKAGGLWRRTLKSKEVNIEIRLFGKLTSVEEKELRLSVQKYGKFLNLSPKII